VRTSATAFRGTGGEGLRSMLLRPRRFGTPLVLGAALATFAGLAATSHGFPVQHVSVNDGGIWVTNNADGLIGRFAKPIAQLDGQVTPASESSNVDVWQDGPVVAAYDATGGRIYAVNVFQPAFYDAGQAISPVTGGIALGDSTLAVLSTDHELRAATLGAGGGSLSALSATAKPLAAHLPANAAVAVGGDDTIWVAGGGELRSFPSGATAPTVSSLPLSVSDPMQVTTVGDVPVVADPATGTLYLPDSGKPVPLHLGDALSGFELQQPSGASDVVVFATSQALYSANLSNGQLTTLSSGHSGTVAQPVQVAGCVHAAWANGSAGSYVRSCGVLPPATRTAQAFSLDDSLGAPSLVFRVNNGSVVLNDTTDGDVFLVDRTVTIIKPKWQLSSVADHANTQSQAYRAQQKNQLTASPVTQGVRPGTTTVVHVLDSTRGNPNATYVVSAVGAPDQSGVTVAISPDAQTVLATVTTLSTDAHFQYTIDDGQGHTASNEVTLVPRSPDQNDPPALRAGYQPPPLKVASAGSLVVPVIGDWRDFDGDPLYLEPSSVQASAGSAAVTTGGALSFTAPQTSADETVTLSYGVSDGRVARPSTASLKISVLGSKSTRFVAPVAEPDAALAVVGAAVTLQPLANNLPGVDPTNRNARLTLAAPVPAVSGAAVATDLTTGTVTFTAQHPGDFFLTYTAAYGAAPTATGTIRVHVVPATGTPLPPVTTPAVAVLHGQQPAVVDVLANDFDPQGWILGVTGASTADQGVHVAVVDQRWLRVSADDLAPGKTATVDYTVSDGKGSATGTVAVSAMPADLNADQITTTEAEVTVQAGNSAAVPVLAGDTSSTGLPLSLDGVPPTAEPPVPGLLLGIQGGDIRVVAPAAAAAEEETAVSYVATDADGTTATGTIDVTIMPPPSKAHPDQAPDPQEVDARETAGDVVVIPIPVDGVDPEGDSVTVTGVTTAPALGRIVAVGPDSVSYQSYPGSLGTDTFGYQVTDPYGLTGTAQVRIAVLPPGLPQPPVAVDDVINAPPGASLHWNVLANDFIAPGDKAVIEPLSKTNTSVPAGLRVAGSYVYLTVPASPSDPPVQFTYGLTDGGSTASLAQVVVHAVAGAKLPPIANDAIAPPPAARATTVTVNVLKQDDDPVGSPSDLKISWAPAGVTVHGPDLIIKLTAHPRQVPYQITAPDGLTATAVVYVPGLVASAIRLKPGARITLKQDGSVTVPLSSVLTDASGRQLKITTVAQLSASPAGDITVSANQATAFQVHALGRYAGPGAVTVQVYDGTTLQDPNGQTATVTIPVQVGSTAPVLRCTADPLGVVEGGAPQTWAIGQLCQLWVNTTVAASQPRYTVAWARPVSGVSASAPGGASLQLTAASGAAPGATGTLLVTPVGATVGATLNVAVIKAPLPVGSPVSVTVKAGQSIAVNLSQHVASPLARPDIEVLGVTRAAGLAVTESGSTVTITPARTAVGTIGLVATVTDAAGRADRGISVPITVDVIGVGANRGRTGAPGAPGAPTATTASQTIVVSFANAAANGAPIEYYTVYANGAPHQCAASPCTITGLANGTRYSVYVTATNSVGRGAPSPTTTVRLDAVPGQVTGLATTTGNGQVTLTWQPVSDAGAPVTGYQVEISPPPAGQPQIIPVGRLTSRTFTGLTDGTTYTFTVQAANAAGDGPWSLGVAATPFGRPATMAAPTAAGAPVPDAANTRAITVSWTPAQGNGSPITTYTVYEYQSGSNAGPWNQVAAQTVDGGTTSTSFTVNNDNSWYEYAVTATSPAGTSAQSPLSTPAVQAATAAPPGAPTGLTAKAADDAVQFSFTAGAANSAQISSIEYGINATAESGTIPGPFTAGTAYTETITNAMSAAIVNGTPVTVYIAECNDAGLCSAWAGPSNQVTPYGPPNPPQAAATANGTAITFAWSGGGGNAQPVATYHVCIDADCADHTTAGTQTVTYGYGQTHTLTVYIVDTAGEQSATATATATTGAAPGPAPTTAPAPGPTTAPAPAPSTAPAPTPTGGAPAALMDPSFGAMYEQADDHGYFDLPVEIYGNGLPATLTVCVNGACSDTPESAFEGSEVGDIAGLQGYDTTYTVTAYITDSAGDRAPATGAVSTTVTTPAAGAPTPAPTTAPAPPPTTAPAQAPLTDPTVTLDLQPGNLIYWNVNGTGDDLPLTVTVCADGACSDHSEAASDSGYLVYGSFTGNSSTTYTVTAYVTDSSGQRAPATGTASASVTTPAAGAPNVVVNAGTIICTQVGGCPWAFEYTYTVDASNFLPNTVLTYSCSPVDPGEYTGPETDSSGDASFTAACTGTGTSPTAPTETITVSDGTNSVPGTSLSAKPKESKNS
jgi:large repetitive protein